MSTILEALRKSEQERKLNNVPTLSDLPAPQEASRWPLVGFIVLGMILLLLIGFLTSQWLAKDKRPSDSNIVVSNETLSTDTPAAQPESDILVNVVSYSEQADLRFVMINGKMFREGDFVRGGLKVEEIRTNEVVLNLRGKKITRTP